MNAYVKKRLHVVLALLLCLSLAILPCAAHAAWQVDGSLQIIFLDVGQADAALVFSGGQTMLIDSGNAADSNTMYAVMQRYGIRELDYVI